MRSETKSSLEELLIRWKNVVAFFVYKKASKWKVMYCTGVLVGWFDRHFPAPWYRRSIAGYAVLTLDKSSD